MVLQLGAGLLLPLGARNALLQSAGFAPAFPATPLASDVLQPFRHILNEMMERHAPYPALLVDRYWNVIEANVTAQTLLAPLQTPGRAPNVVRMMTDHPRAHEIIGNLPEVLAELLTRLQLEALEAAGDAVFEDLLAALERACAKHPAPAVARRAVLPVVVQIPAGELRFLSAIAHFGTTEDVTVRDLRLELLFPADAATRAVLTEIAPARERA